MNSRDSLIKTGLKKKNKQKAPLQERSLTEIPLIQTTETLQ